MFNSKNVKLAKSIVNDAYISSGAESGTARRAQLLKTLLSQRSVPECGWPDSAIEQLLQELAAMDSNNFIGNVGCGEREGRVLCPLVARRHFGLAHGIGRSGDVAAIQPKAAGSSLINKLNNALLLDFLRRVCNLRAAQRCALLPMATGMTLALCLIALRARRPRGARYVVWPRIDQKSCFKAILTAGLEPVVVEQVLDGDELRTDVDAVAAAVDRLGPDNVVCVFTTTSCFAPRVPDDVPAVAALCKARGVAHLVNNAYGLQCGRCCALVERGCRAGRVDAFVQSTDKNLMVPVGGAIVASPDKKFVDAVCQTYSGRASMAPVLDVFMSLLSAGKEGYAALWARRKALLPYFKEKLEAVAAKHGGAGLLRTPHNKISFAFALDCLVGGGGGGGGGHDKATKVPPTKPRKQQKQKQKMKQPTLVYEISCCPFQAGTDCVKLLLGG